MKHTLRDSTSSHLKKECELSKPKIDTLEGKNELLTLTLLEPEFSGTGWFSASKIHGK